MDPGPAPTSEPAPLDRPAPFEAGDFHALGPSCARDPQYNDRRLATRRKLLAVAKAAAARIAGGRPAGPKLEVRTSLHHPHAFNHGQVRRIWAYLCRAKAEKARLRRVLGADLAKDLDAAYKNAYLCVAIEAEALETSLRIHADAWYDGQNLKHRAAREGPQALLALLNGLDGYRVQLADWKGEWRCGALTRDALEELLGYWVPGEHLLAVERRQPVPAASPAARAAACAAEVPGALVEELCRLVPLYRWAAWSKESDFLFAS